MDANAPTPDELPVVPDPHAGEALPEHQSGRRPGTPDVVRPEQDEPGGPLAGLVGAASAQVAEAIGSEDAHDALVGMGVEEEGVESGQLLGFVAATLVVVALLAFVLIYFIYAPFRDHTATRVNGVEVYPELEQSRVDARAKLETAALGADGTYSIPIGRAMGLVAASYGASASDPALSRAQFNTLAVNRTAGRAVQGAPPTDPDTLAAPPADDDADDDAADDDTGETSAAGTAADPPPATE